MLHIDKRCLASVDIVLMNECNDKRSREPSALSTPLIICSTTNLGVSMIAGCVLAFCQALECRITFVRGELKPFNKKGGCCSISDDLSCF